jgi:hypothetical protein
MPSPLELQLMNARAERAVVAALREIDGASDEPQLALMTAALIAVQAVQGVSVIESQEKAYRMLAAYIADVSTKALNALRVGRELLGPPAGQA